VVLAYLNLNALALGVERESCRQAPLSGDFVALERLINCQTLPIVILRNHPISALDCDRYGDRASKDR